MSDTIKKIAAAAAEAGITDDQLVAALRAAFGTKAPKESPVFTGSGTIPNWKVTGDLQGATGTFTGVLNAANPTADTNLVTLAHLKALSWLANGGLDGVKIKDGTVTTAKIAANAIDSAKVKDGSLLFADLAAAAIATNAQAIAGTAANLLLTPAAAKAMIDNALSGNTDSGVPSGVMVPFAGKTVPDGWLLCNGASLAKASYPDLFAAIGYTWGGSGNTFYLPNYNGRHILGTTSPSSVGGTVGAGLPDITGRLRYEKNGYGDNRLEVAGSLNVAVGSGNAESGGSAGGGRNATIIFDASNANSIYGRSSTASVPAAYALIIIRV